MKNCSNCYNFGRKPICPKCHRNRFGLLPNYLNIENDETIPYYQRREKFLSARAQFLENIAELTHMYNNMRKFNMISTGSKSTDSEIYKLFGDPWNWR